MHRIIRRCRTEIEVVCSARVLTSNAETIATVAATPTTTTTTTTAASLVMYVCMLAAHHHKHTFLTHCCCCCYCRRHAAVLDFFHRLHFVVVAALTFLYTHSTYDISACYHLVIQTVLPHCHTNQKKNTGRVECNVQSSCARDRHVHSLSTRKSKRRRSRAMVGCVGLLQRIHNTYTRICLPTMSTVLCMYACRFSGSALSPHFMQKHIL